MKVSWNGSCMGKADSNWVSILLELDYLLGLSSVPQHIFCKS